MTESPRDEKKTGCFAWLVQIKKSVNERWAKARNRLRQRFHRTKGPPQPRGSTQRKRYTGYGYHHGCRKKQNAYPYTRTVDRKECIGFLASATPSNESEVDDKTTEEKVIIRATVDGGPDCTEVRTFVVDLIEKASQKYRAEMAILPPPLTPRDYTNTDTVVQ